MPTNFERSRMVMNQDATGWRVDDADIVRLGEESFELVDANPRAEDGKSLPQGRPFSCSKPTLQNGRMVAKLRFKPDLVTRWHDSAQDPFDSRRALKLTMRVDDGSSTGVTEFLFVDLSCAKMDHPQPVSSLSSLAQRAVTAVHDAIYFAEPEAEMAVEGPAGAGAK